MGSGTTPASVSDTALAAPLATWDEYEFDVGAGWRRHVFEFPLEAVVGTVSEVGIGATGTALFSRALVPSPQTITSYQTLTVIYELRLVPPAGDSLVSLVIPPATTATQCTIRPALIGNASAFAWGPTGKRAQFVPGIPTAPRAYDCLMGLRDGAPTGDSDPRDHLTPDAYVPGSHAIEALACWSQASANFKHTVRSLLFFTSGYGAWQIQFDPAIPKACQEALKLRLRLAWSRAT